MRHTETGFTLIEVLVALVVSALLLAVILQGALLARTRLYAAEDRRTASLYGRYLLLRGSVLDYGAGNGQGRQGRLSWTSDEHLVSANAQHTIGLMRLHTQIRDAQRHVLFDRSSLRMKRLPQP